MALFHVLYALLHDSNRMEIIHFNHMVRKESMDEVRAFTCQVYDLFITYFRKNSSANGQACTV
jgi:hypothetical protein